MTGVRHRAIFATAAAVCLCAAALGQEPMTCAIIPVRSGANMTDSPALALLETALTKSGKLRLVERARIDDIFDEQTLQAALGAESLKARRELGQLLRADLLVILEQTKSVGGNQIQLTIAETRRGLRLATDLFLWRDESLQATIDLLADAVETARLKITGGVQTVIAIPPFECDDLAFEFAHFSSTYSSVMERRLMQQSGVLVVELTEARTLARELAVSEGGDSVRRPMPYYVLGRYKTTGHGAKRSVEMRIVLRRDERVIATRHHAGLEPDEIGPHLRAVADEMVARVPGRSRETAALRTDREGELLRQRAERFQRLGYWEEALSLYEASLLLLPNRADVRFEAIVVCAKLAEGSYDPTSGEEIFREKALRGFSYFRVGLGHIERFLRRAGSHKPQDRDRVVNRLVQFHSSLSFIHGFARRPRLSDVRALCDDLYKREYDVLFGILEDRARMGNLDEDLAGIVIGSLMHGQRYTLESNPALHYEHRLRTIRAIQHMPRAHPWTVTAATLNLYEAQRLTPRFETFLAQLDQLPSEKVRTAVATMRRKNVRARQRREASALRQSQAAPAAKSAAQPPAEIEFDRLALTAVDQAGNRVSPVPRIFAWLRCAAGIDFVACLKQLYVMKDKGTLKRIFKSDEQFFNFRDVCYDGIFVWAPVKRPDPLVLVIDPLRETIWRFTAADGLPPMNRSVSATAIGPGRLCISSSFSGDSAGIRTWIALLQIDSDGTKTVDVIHEARLQPSGDRRGHVSDIDVAYGPSFMVTLRDPADSGRVRVLAGRGVWTPLLIDPRDRTVEAVPSGLAGRDFGAKLYTHAGAAYWVGRWMKDSSMKDRSILYRVRFPHLVREPVTKIQGTAAESIVLFDDGNVHLIGPKWRTAQVSDMNFTARQASIPGRMKWRQRRAARSHHYGLVVWPSEGRAVYAVRFGNTRNRNGGGR